MSRLLEMLRRRRGETAPGRAAAGADSGVPDRPTRNRAVVLEALSGGTPRVPWYRSRWAAALCVLAVTACFLSFFFLYLASTGRARAAGAARTAIHEPARPPAAAAQAATAVRPPGTPPPAGGPPVAASSSSSPAVDARTPVAVTPQPGRKPVREIQQGETRARAHGGTGREVAIAAAPSGTGGPTGDARLELALRYQQGGEPEKAIAEYRAILQANESNAQAHNNLGLLYQAKGLPDAAIEEFRRAIAIDPAYDKARNNLGVAFLRAGKLDLAASEFRRLLAENSVNQQAMVNLALVERAAGRPDEARETLIQALALDDRNAVAHYNLALLYEDVRETARALDHYEAYLKYAGSGDSAQVAAVRERCQVLRQTVRR